MTDVHKCAFGRTDLFLDNPQVLLSSVRACGSLARRAEGVVYHRLGSSPPRDCWHCCEAIDGECLPLPRAYDRTLEQYYVYGHFCSAECAKAYVMEHAGFDRGHQLSVFSQMMRDVYGVLEPVVEAPPRIALRRFGGVLEKTLSNVQCRLVTPPFVSYCMLVEECAPEHTLAETAGSLLNVSECDMMDDSVDAPEEPALYGDFLRRQNNPPTPSEPRPKAPRKRKGQDDAAPSNRQGTLRPFARKSP